jgi:hypothetical protein
VKSIPHAPQAADSAIRDDYRRCAFRNFPVYDRFDAAICSGVPVATISPPA